MNKYFAEFMGTFLLVFIGCGSVSVNEISEGALGLVGISLAFGLVVMALVYTFGHISGAHINPAVTVALASVGLFPKKNVIPYITAQIVGAILATLVLKFSLQGVVSDEKIALGVTEPLKGNIAIGIIWELILTFLLMLVIMGSATDNKSASGFAGLSIGITVTFDILVGGPITGASMNPARSIGPANCIWRSHISSYLFNSNHSRCCDSCLFLSKSNKKLIICENRVNGL